MRHALLLAGGQGKRFWPRSRRSRPKQFMPFEGGRSLLRVTSDRLAGVVPVERQWVVTHRDYVDQVLAELPGIDPSRVIGEPVGRNTAPAIGVGAALIQAQDPDAVMVVQAADHWIRDTRRFGRLIDEAFRQAERRRTVVLIGFPPQRAAVGFGYIERGAVVPTRRGYVLHEVAAFKEKPDQATAEKYLGGGRHLWNGCMFFWHASTILEGLRTQLPELHRLVARMTSSIAAGRDPRRVVDNVYRRSPSVAIEPAVVEHLTDAVVLEGDCGWEDVGTWGSLAELLRQDVEGNIVEGRHVGVDTQGSLILSDSGVVATLGVQDLIIVKDRDAVLVVPRSREGELRSLIEQMEARGEFDDQL